MTERGTHDDLRTVELPVQPPSAEEFAEAPRTVIDDAWAFDGVERGPDPAPDPGSTEVSADPAADSAAPADPIHVLPTQQIAAPRRASTSVSKLSASVTATTSPVDVMKLDEIARTRVFLQVVFALCGGGIVRRELTALRADRDRRRRSSRSGTRRHWTGPR